jgi:hypothetical protein
MSSKPRKNKVKEEIITEVPHIEENSSAELLTEVPAEPTENLINEDAKTEISARERKALLGSFSKKTLAARYGIRF